MPVYELRCSSCREEIEILLPIGKSIKKCPACGELSLQKLVSAAMGRVAGQAKTVGQQAEINSKKMSSEQLAEINKPTKGKFHGKLPEGGRIIEKSKSPEIPWYRSGEVPGTKKMEKPLDIRKVKDTQKFIMTGDTN